MPLLTLLLVLSDLLELTFTVTKHITVFTIALTQHVMHLVRATDIDTRIMHWVDTSTQTFYDAVNAAYTGRKTSTTDKPKTIVYKQSLNTSVM